LGNSLRESVPLSSWEEERGVGVGEIHPNYQRLFDQIAYIADPVSSLSFKESSNVLWHETHSLQDGYLVELIPQDLH
jgi:lactoylglutathione lyase